MDDAMSGGAEPLPDGAGTPSGGLAGQLLVATPALVDGHFRRSVVLVLDHDDDGALGVILNRRTTIEVDDVLPGWSSTVTAPGGVYEGGPVATDSALAVGLLAVDPEDEPIGWRKMFGRVGLVDLDAPSSVIEDALAGMRIYAGYAGWGDGQLEAEIEDGSWLVLAAADGDLLHASPDTLWRDVLRRQGSELRLLSTYPEDPTLN
ncbi:YqgE/AlgH family protein [Solicola gregarius]|uniref:UPF0301 protein L0C25_16365 n=1 Tax=Solicola gregarius TaxID=2908642 RepID=A0AA46YJA0_9ACTN|nr:YqgE/AlgH family protein [Solicola gregarius]UYM04107.1 YqgE/AlgH family protein [Solicola gregarius]